MIVQKAETSSMLRLIS